MHPVLAEILWTNLIQNAIKHNISDGTIKVRTSLRPYMYLFRN